MAVLSLFVQSQAEWKESRKVFLKHAILFTHLRDIKMGTSSSEKTPLAKYKPALIFFGLIDQLHKTLNRKYTQEKDTHPPVPATPEQHENATLRLRYNDQKVLEDLKEVLSMYEDEMLPCESTDELMDVIEVMDIALEDSDTCETFITKCENLAA
eukprot:GFYU01001640.1.p1 GENE.GFYU01001640.1~~GFYU01001640.1.p1  ORF type:complete len:155 (-),score=49.19 GFYU01001640.1:58-522(-)